MVSTTNIPITGRRRRHVQRPTIAGERLRFDKSGRVLSREEQEKIAKARGLCPGCGLRTHAVSTYLHRLRPLDNEYVSNGVCRACHPTAKKTALLQRASKPLISNAKNADPKCLVSFDTTDGPSEVSPDVETKDGAGKIPSKRSCFERQHAVRRLSAGPSTWELLQEEVNDDKDNTDSTPTEIVMIDMSAMRLLSEEEAPGYVSSRAIAGKSMKQMTSSDNVDVQVETPRSSMMASANSQSSARSMDSEISMTSIKESLRQHGIDPDEFLHESVSESAITRGSRASPNIIDPEHCLSRRPRSTMMDSANSQNSTRSMASDTSMTSIKESLRQHGIDPDEFLLQSFSDNIASEKIF